MDKDKTQDTNTSTEELDAEELEQARGGISMDKVVDRVKRIIKATEEEFFN